jgi:hypothetical protein
MPDAGILAEARRCLWLLCRAGASAGLDVEAQFLCRYVMHAGQQVGRACLHQVAHNGVTLGEEAKRAVRVNVRPLQVHNNKITRFAFAVQANLRAPQEVKRSLSDRR